MTGRPKARSTTAVAFTLPCDRSNMHVTRAAQRVLHSAGYGSSKQLLLTW
jgi:hypothetical protein